MLHARRVPPMLGAPSRRKGHKTMVELAVDIVALCIVVAAGIAALAILGAVWFSFGHWLAAAPGRPRRVWTLLGITAAVLLLLAWRSLSPATLAAAAAWAVLVGLAVGILRIKDRWPAVSVWLIWLTWWGWLLGLLAVVLHERGWLP